MIDDVPDYGLEVAAFAARQSCAHLPRAVVDKIVILLIDTIGVALAGSKEDHARQARAVALATEARPNVTIFGSAAKTSAPEAAFANGVAAHSIDFDDTHKFVHPGCAVVPAVLALGELRDVDGPTLLAALTVGYETSIRVAFAAGVEHRHRGYHPTGTCNVFGAAVGAARVLGLDAERAAAAIGAASSMASGLTQYRFDGAANKHLHGGLAARSGVLAALLAEQGFRGTRHALDGEQGYLNIYSDGGDLNALIGELGQRFDLLDTEIKPYPSCRQSHGSVDLALDLAVAHNVTSDDIEAVAIEIYTYADKPWHTTNAIPASPLEAMLCIPYCAASAILNKRLGLSEFREPALADPQLHELIGKITVTANPELDKNWPRERGARLTCRTKGGQEIILSTINPKGGREDPFTHEDIVKKFSGLAEGVLPKAQQKAFIAAAGGLTGSTKARDLLATLGTSD